MGSLYANRHHRATGMPWFRENNYWQTALLILGLPGKNDQAITIHQIEKVIAHQRILTIVPRKITQQNCPHWRQTAKAGFVPLRKAGPLFCSMRGPSSNCVSTFYWKMGNSECSHIVPVLSRVTVNNHASLLSSPDGDQPLKISRRTDSWSCQQGFTKTPLQISAVCFIKYSTKQASEIK